MASVVAPHNAWEESVIFPEVEDACGSRWPTKLMRFDHAQVSRASLDLDTDIEILTRQVPLHE